jgi:hypothetical protein
MMPSLQHTALIMCALLCAGVPEDERYEGDDMEVLARAEEAEEAGFGEEEVCDISALDRVLMPALVVAALLGSCLHCQQPWQLDQQAAGTALGVRTRLDKLG